VAPEKDDLAPGPALEVIQLVTVDGGGRPRVSLLSAAEVTFGAAGAVFLLIWEQSTSRANLLESGQGMLARTDAAGFVSTWFEVVRIGEVAVPGSRRLSLITGRITDSKSDQVTYAELLHGIEFTLSDPQVLTRWREQQQVLEAAAGRGGEPAPYDSTDLVNEKDT